MPALAAVALERWSARWAWLLAGFLYGLASWWAAGALAVLLAAPLMAFGATLGARLHGLVARPGRGVPRLVLAIGLALPAVAGFVDLVLRARTP